MLLDLGDTETGIPLADYSFDNMDRLGNSCRYCLSVEHRGDQFDLAHHCSDLASC